MTPCNVCTEPAAGADVLQEVGPLELSGVELYRGAPTITHKGYFMVWKNYRSQL